MDFALNAEQQMLHESATRFFADHHPPSRARQALSWSDAAQQQLWHDMAEMGWMSLLSSEEQGGLGLGLTEAHLIAEAAGAQLLNLPWASSAVLLPLWLRAAPDDAPALRDDYRGIDHLALGMEAESRDNWIIFFRTVFGFTLEHEQTLPDPYGLVRSLAVHSPQGNIRLALNISQSRATQIARSVACYQGAGLQHAAFACHDLPATLASLPQVAGNALPIPANYYEDLLARFGEDVQVNLLKNHQILYDRDGSGGEFLHLYTRPFSAGRFFFELTERRNGYALYGAVNAAVRLSAIQYT